MSSDEKIRFHSRGVYFNFTQKTRRTKRYLLAPPLEVRDICSVLRVYGNRSRCHFLRLRLRRVTAKLVDVLDDARLLPQLLGLARQLQILHGGREGGACALEQNPRRYRLCMRTSYTGIIILFAPSGNASANDIHSQPPAERRKKTQGNQLPGMTMFFTSSPFPRTPPLHFSARP